MLPVAFQSIGNPGPAGSEALAVLPPLLLHHAAAKALIQRRPDRVGVSKTFWFVVKLQIIKNPLLFNCVSYEPVVIKLYVIAFH